MPYFAIVASQQYMFILPNFNKINASLSNNEDTAKIV